MNAPHAGVAPPLSRRAESLGTENAFVVLAEVNALQRQGKDIVSFCIGQPDFPTPVNVQDAAVAAIRAGKHGYTPSAGISAMCGSSACNACTLRSIASAYRPTRMYTCAGMWTTWPAPGMSDGRRSAHATARSGYAASTTWM